MALEQGSNSYDCKNWRNSQLDNMCFGLCIPRGTRGEMVCEGPDAEALFMSGVGLRDKMGGLCFLCGTQTS
eukprot:1070265-Pyramimonas_sp.AAC.1